jgi:hypothetical protein
VPPASGEERKADKVNNKLPMSHLFARASSLLSRFPWRLVCTFTHSAHAGSFLPPRTVTVMFEAVVRAMEKQTDLGGYIKCECVVIRSFSLKADGGFVDSRYHKHHGHSMMIAQAFEASARYTLSGDSKTVPSSNPSLLKRSHPQDRFGTPPKLKNTTLPMTE